MKGRETVPEKQYEIIALTLRYWYIVLVAFIFFKVLKATWRGYLVKDCNEDSSARDILVLLILFVITTFGLLAAKAHQGFNIRTFVLGVLISAIFLLQYSLFTIGFSGFDKHLLLTVDTLAAIGFVMLQRLNPELAFRQVEWFGIGNISMLIFTVIIRNIKMNRRLRLLLMIGGCVLLTLPIILGKEIGGAKNWLLIGKYSMQPSEFVKIILVVMLADDFWRCKTYSKRMPVLVFLAASILLVIIQKDLGAAFLYFMLFVFLYFVATSDWILTAGSVSVAILGALISYHFFSHVRVRVAAWRNPWADIEDKGYQIAQSLIAISSGGLFGLGLGLGSPEVVPASKTDFIFSAICEEMGVIMGLFVIGFYAIICCRGTTIALRATHPFRALLSMGAVVYLSIQSFIILGGVIKLIPLTGVTLPFVSYGGSSMMTSMGFVGIVQGIVTKEKAQALSQENDKSSQEEYGEGGENGQ